MIPHLLGVPLTPSVDVQNIKAESKERVWGFCKATVLTSYLHPVIHWRYGIGVNMKKVLELFFLFSHRKQY